MSKNELAAELVRRAQSKRSEIPTALLASYIQTELKKEVSELKVKKPITNLK